MARNVFIRVTMDPKRGGRARRLTAAYRIAGQTILCDLATERLRAYRITLPDNAGRPYRYNPRSPLEFTHTTFDGPAWLANGWRHITCSSSDAEYLIDITGFGSFYVLDHGNAIVTLEPAPTALEERLVETLFGPLLILALALKDVWCLHASAVLIENRVIAFIGESGVGKSTLAAFLTQIGSAGLGRVADDILPVTLSLNGVASLPHFPQLKLPPERQPASGVPDRLPLDAVYVVGPQADAKQTVEIRTLEQWRASLFLVRHTVAARLFDNALLAQHLSACTQLAECIPVRLLSFPHDYSSLPLVRDLISRDLLSLSA